MDRSWILPGGGKRLIIREWTFFQSKTPVSDLSYYIFIPSLTRYNLKPEARAEKILGLVTLRSQNFQRGIKFAG